MVVNESTLSRRAKRTAVRIRSRAPISSAFHLSSAAQYNFYRWEFSSVQLEQLPLKQLVVRAKLTTPTSFSSHTPLAQLVEQHTLSESFNVGHHVV